MKLSIHDGILEKCILTGIESGVYIPQEVKEIADDAFAHNPQGKIKRMVFSDGLERIQPHAFRGIGHLLSLSAYSRAQEEDIVFPKGTEHEKLRADTLVIHKGKRGNAFVLDEWMNEIPKDLYVFTEADLSLSRNDIKDSLSDIRIRRFYLYDADGLSEQTYSFVQFPLVKCAQTVGFVNTVVNAMDEENSTEATLQFSPQANAGEVLYSYETSVNNPAPSWWKWCPVNQSGEPAGIRDLNNMKRLDLPRGQKEIFDDVIHCESLTKVTIPLEVCRIHNSFRDCASLRNVYIEEHMDNELEIDCSSFVQCPALKEISLYEKGWYGGQGKIKERIPKTEWLKYHFIKKVLNDFFKEYPLTADKMNVSALRKQYSHEEIHGNSGPAESFAQRAAKLKKLTELFKASINDSFLAHNRDAKRTMEQCVDVINLIERTGSFG